MGQRAGSSSRRGSSGSVGHAARLGAGMDTSPGARSALEGGLRGAAQQRANTHNEMQRCMGMRCTGATAPTSIYAKLGLSGSWVRGPSSYTSQLCTRNTPAPLQTHTGVPSHQRARGPEPAAHRGVRGHVGKAQLPQKHACHGGPCAGAQAHGGGAAGWGKAGAYCGAVAWEQKGFRGHQRPLTARNGAQ